MLQSIVDFITAIINFILRRDAEKQEQNNANNITNDIKNSENNSGKVDDGKGDDVFDNDKWDTT